MKVLLINSVCGIRSTGRICTDIAETLETQGHQCKIAYGREVVPEKFKKYAVRIGTNNSVRRDAFFTRLFDNAGFNSTLATKKFIKWIKEYNPDVIHLHNLHGYYINIKILFNFLAKSNIPVVWTLHDCWAFTGHCSHFVSKKCNKWQTQCFKCPSKKSYPKSILIDASKRNYQAKKRLFTSVKNMTIVTPSDWLKNLVEKSFLGKYPVKTIHNGIDLSVFKPTESNFREQHGLTDKKIILGVASAWGKGKGLDDFIELSKKINDEYKVVLVGLKKEQVKNLPQQILAIERTNSIEQLAEIYTAADVFFNPSRQETMGLTTVEAMACGTPAVVSNFTAVPEVMDENGGIVVEDLQVDNVISMLEQVVSGSYNSTLETAKKFEKNKQYIIYIELYESMDEALKF